MKAIDLKSIIETTGLDIKEVASQLFPGNKYPRLALNRVIAGNAVLDANQISKLALLAGLEIHEVYAGTGWKTGNKKGVHTFTNGLFKAELDTNTWVTKIFHKESLFHESIINSGSTPISTYLEELNRIITKHQNNEQN